MVAPNEPIDQIPTVRLYADNGRLLFDKLKEPIPLGRMGDPMDVANEAASVHVPAVAADTDNVSGRCDVHAGAFAQRNIFAAACVET